MKEEELKAKFCRQNVHSSMRSVVILNFVHRPNLSFNDPRYLNCFINHADLLQCSLLEYHAKTDRWASTHWFRSTEIWVEILILHLVCTYKYSLEIWNIFYQIFSKMKFFSGLMKKDFDNKRIPSFLFKFLQVLS